MPSAKPWLKSRQGNNYTITFPTLPSLQVKPTDVDLYQEKMSHDILQMKFNNVSTTWYSLLKTGVPVLFTWQQGDKSSSWTGYVSGVSTQTAAQTKRVLQVTCVGASYVLKNRASRVWRKKTVTDVARSIAKEFGLEFKGDPSKRQFAQLSMTGQTYWQFLQEQAKRIGYIFIVQNTTMFMYPLEKYLTRSTATAPVLGMEYPYFAANLKAFDRTLDSFNVLKSDYIDSKDALYTSKNTSGVNPVTGKVLKSTASPTKTSATRALAPTPLFIDFSNEVVTDSRMTKQAAEDLALGAKFAFPAAARGQGDPRIAPYKAVYVIGTSEDTDGYWAVSKVHHKLNIAGFYEVDLSLVTDGVGATTETPFRKAPGFNQGTINVDSIVIDSSRSDAPITNTVLNSRGAPVKESAQGFNSNNASTWKGNKPWL